MNNEQELNDYIYNKDGNTRPLDFRSFTCSSKVIGCLLYLVIKVKSPAMLRFFERRARHVNNNIVKNFFIVNNLIVIYGKN